MVNRFVLNTTLQVGTRAGELASGLLVNIWLARQWGSAAFGEVGFYVSLAGMCAFLFDMNLGTLLTRRIARDPERLRDEVARGLVALLPLAVLGSLALVAVGQHLGGGGAVLALACVHLTLTAVYQVMRAGFLAIERTAYEAGAVLGERLVWCLAGLWLGLGAPSVEALFLGMIAGKALNVALCAFAFRRAIAPCRRPAGGWWRDGWALVPAAVPFGLSHGCFTLYTTFDMAWIAAVGRPEQAGYYRSAALLLAAATLVGFSITNVLYPRMCGSEGDRARYGRTAARLGALAGVPLAVFIACYAPAIVSALFGAAYAPAAPMLQVLGLAIPLRLLHQGLGAALTAGDRHGWRTAAMAAGAVASVALHVALVPRWEGLGAAAALVLTDLGLLLALGGAWRRHQPGGGTGLVAGMQALVLAAAVVLPLAWAGVPMLVAAPLAAVGYGLLLLMTPVLSPFERALLRDGAIEARPSA